MIGAFSFQKSRYHALQCDALGIVLKGETARRAVGSGAGSKPGFQWKADPGERTGFLSLKTPLLSIFRPVERPEGFGG